MGLDTVELIMDIEDEFEIEISNEAAPNLATVGDFYLFILNGVAARGVAFDERDIWDRLKHIFVDRFGIPEQHVLPSAHIVYDLGLD